MDCTLHDLEEWEFGASGIANPKSSTLKRYFELIDKTRNVPGDIAEFGVSRGASIVTTALMLDQLNIDKLVFGFDTFVGFPSYHKYDNPKMFDYLARSKVISSSHYNKVTKNLNYARIRFNKVTPKNISNSGDFSKNDYNYVKRKVSFFNLSDTVILKKGDFTKNLRKKIQNTKFSLILLDSDLYLSYAKTLPVIWDSLSVGGYIYLDEYYSLKFPGPRIAVNDFVSKNKCNLIKLPSWLNFERWAIFKEK